jgi:RNA-binding protein 39
MSGLRAYGTSSFKVFQKFPIQVKASEAEKNFLASKEKAMLREGGNAPDSRVYIGNLHPSVSDTDINAILSQFGPVDYVNLHRDEMGNSKCFAFARFTRADDAKIAMEKLTGLDIGGKLIKVGPVIDPKANNNSSTTTNTIATANVPSAIDPSLTYQNNTNSWKLDDDEGTGMQMNSQSRAMLMAKLGQAAGISVPTPILPPMPTPVPIVPQIPNITGSPSRCFMIRNMFDIEEEKRNGAGWDLDIKEDVSEECGKFGPVEHCFVENVKPGGMVYVKFASVDASINAAVSLNGRYFAGRMITITYIELTQYNSILAK